MARQDDTSEQPKRFPVLDPASSIDWIILELQDLEWEEVVASDLKNQHPNLWSCNICEKDVPEEKEKLFAGTQKSAFGRPLLCQNCHQTHIIEGKETR